MVEQEDFALIAAGLSEDRRWIRRVRLIVVVHRLASIALRGLGSIAPAAEVWLL